MADNIVKVKMPDYSYRGGGYTFVSPDQVMGGARDNLGAPADANTVKKLETPLANAINNGTQITTPMWPSGLKYRLDDGTEAQPALGFGPSTNWDNGLSHTGSAAGTNVSTYSINGTAVTKWAAAQLQVVAGTSPSAPGLAGISATDTGFAITSTPTIDVCVNGVKVGIFDQTAAPGIHAVMGAGSGFSYVGGRIEVNPESAANPGGAPEGVVRFVTVPANTLDIDQRGVEIWACGTCAANGNAKTIRLRWAVSSLAGTVLVHNDVTANPNGTDWIIHAIVHRGDPSVQVAHATMVMDATWQTSQVTAPTEDQTAAIRVELTVQATTASDVTVKCLDVRYLA